MAKKKIKKNNKSFGNIKNYTYLCYVKLNKVNFINLKTKKWEEF